MNPKKRKIKHIPISPEIVELLNAREDEFERVFRRKPGKDDYVFFENFLISEDDISDEMEAVCTSANIDPAISYAIKKTGRILTAENVKYLAKRDIREWNNAIKEYEQTSKTRRVDDREEAYKSVSEEYSRLPLIMGSAISNAVPPKGDTASIQSTQILFSATRTLKTVRAISLLLENNLAEDGLNLTRSIFENYLNGTFALTFPHEAEAIFLAKAGVASGKYRFKHTKNGKVDYHNILDLTTGRVIQILSYAQLAQKSPFLEDNILYQSLYHLLSRYSHFHPLSLRNYYGSKGFSVTERHMINDTMLLTLIMTCMVLDLLLGAIDVPDKSKRDILVYLRHSKGAIVGVLNNGTLLTALTNNVVSVLKKRIKALAAKQTYS